MTLPRLACAALLAALAGCAAPVGPIPTLASARVVSDFQTYQLRRVGVLPVVAQDLQEGLGGTLQSAVLAEFQMATDVEWVHLGGRELVDVEGVEPHATGSYPAESVLLLTQRHRLDGLLVVTVLDHQPYPPQRLGLQAVLLSAETGMSLWQGEVELHAGDERTRRAARSWAYQHEGDLSEDHWELILLSPRRFARLAAAQLARVFRS